MDPEQVEVKNFLEEQVKWCKGQDNILAQIETKLYEMKAQVEYARDHELTSIEIYKLNEQLNILKQEIHYLEQQLQSEVS